MAPTGSGVVQANIDAGRRPGIDCIVKPAAAKQRICASPTIQVVRGGIAEDCIITVAEHCIFNDGISRNRQIANASVDVRKGLFVQVEPLVVVSGRQVDCVDPATVKQCDSMRAQHIHIGICCGTDAVGRIAASGRACVPVQVLDGQDIGHLWGQNISKACVHIAILAFREVGHDGRLPAVICVDRIIGVAGEAIVVTGVTKAQRVPDLVNIGLETVAGQRGALRREPIGGDIDRGRIDRVVGAVPGESGSCVCATIIVIKGYVSIVRHFLERDAGDI